MKKIYLCGGELPTDLAFEHKLNVSSDVLERTVEAALTSTVNYVDEILTARFSCLMQELNIPLVDEKLAAKVKDRIETFASENVNPMGCGPNEADVQEFFVDLLRDLFGVKIEDEDDLDCDECTNGRCYNNADTTSGQWLPCEACNGTGRLTPEQLEAKYPDVPLNSKTA